MTDFSDEALFVTISRQAAEIERLMIENWQLKGALGYEVPGDIPCGEFKCGLCEAKHNELIQVRKNSLDLAGQLIAAEEQIERFIK